MNLRKYHDKVWLPFSNGVDKIIKPYKVLRVIKKLFDIHFTILGVLGILATPPNDIDCYIYIYKRSNPYKYQALSWKMRFKIIGELFHEAWSA